MKLPASVKTNSKYIVGPIYDFVFFIGSPILASIFGYFFVKYFEWGYPDDVYFWGNKASLTGILALTQAHLVVVFYRSHGNPQVFERHPMRFILAPFLIFYSIYFFDWVFTLAGCLVVWWDVYHTSQQNFGLARIYDARSGNPLPSGRWIEKIAHLIFYACPIFAGTYLLSHVHGCGTLGELKLFSFAPIAVKYIEANLSLIRNVSISIGGLAAVLFTLFEVHRFRQGYRCPLPKLLILLSTLSCTIFAWGFNKFGDAYFIVNMYHAVQYFAVVWASEKKQEGAFISNLNKKLGGFAAFLIFFIPPFIIGSWFEFTDAHLPVSLLFSCALLHFWYDGFIWSVRRKEV